MTYFHPERMPVLPERRRGAARRQLEDLVKRSAKSRRRRVKPAVILAGAVGVALTTGAAAFAIAQYEPVTNFRQARCYSIADLSSSRDFMSVTAFGAPGTRTQVKNALSACRLVFRLGYLVAGVPGVNNRPSPGPHPAPKMRVCTMPDGTAVVIVKRQSTCAELRLPADTSSRGAGPP